VRKVQVDEELLDKAKARSRKVRAVSGRRGAGHASGGTRGGLGAARGAVGLPKSSAGRKPRTSIPLGEKIALIDIKDAGHSWSQTLEMFLLNVSLAAARNIYKKRDDYKRRAAASEDLSSPRLRRSYFETVYQGLWDWYKTLQRVGGRQLPVSGSLLEARARRIATELGVTGFQGSPHFIQNWAARYNLRNVALWGQGGSADMEGAVERIAKIRTQLEDYPVDRIYTMDETGLFYRCIPNRSYVQAGQRRQARETKAMKAKDCVTLVLDCSATRSHKIPVAMIGKAKQPLCFKPPRCDCPLPYFSKKSAWMDGVALKTWFETVFLRALRARTTLPVALICDNCGAHEECGSEQVTFIPLPPNCTSIHQPRDLGIIACLKRRYKRRLLDLVVSAFDLNLGNRAVVAASPTAASANAAAATVDAQRPTADASTGGGPANAGPSGAPSVAATGAARAAASINTGPRGALTAAVTAPRSARVAPVSGPTTAAESGQTLGVGRWLSADGSWPAIESNTSRRPADAAHLAVGPTAVRGADGRAARTWSCLRRTKRRGALMSV